MKKRVIIGGSVVIAVICIVVLILILKWNKQDSEIASDSDSSIDLEAIVEKGEEEQDDENTIEKDELDRSTADIVELENSEVYTGIGEENEDIVETTETTETEMIEIAEVEEIDATETMEEESYVTSYDDLKKEYDELMEKGVDNMNDVEKAVSISLAQMTLQYNKNMLDEYLIKLQEVASSVGVSIGSYGAALVENLTEEDEPYYSILKSVNAIGYYFTVNGAVTDTVYLFYVNQDDEVVYYGFVDLLDY